MTICTQPTLIFLIGVSGSGKTTIGFELSKFLRVKFLDGDDFHSQSNIDKMRSGSPLNDQDREPWLKKVRETGIEALEGFNCYSDPKPSIEKPSTTAVVIACSALKRKYRQSLAEGSDVENRNISAVNGGRVRYCFVYLKAPEHLLIQRLELRKNHFMGVKMLQSQLLDLEEPDPSVEDEGLKWLMPISLVSGNGDQKPVQKIVVEILDELWKHDNPSDSFPDLPAVKNLLSAQADNLELQETLALLFEPSDAMKNHLIPRLKELNSKDPIKNYLEILQACEHVLNAGFTIQQRENFLGSHPRIGEVKGLSKLSSKEQGNQGPTDPQVLKRLQELNEHYETVYPGLRYVTFVNGRSRKEIAEEMETLLCEEGRILPKPTAVHDRDQAWLAELSRGIDAIFMIARSRLWSMKRHR